MILVDTSVWIDHLYRTNEILGKKLDKNEVFGHPYVLGELRCGNIQNRVGVLLSIERLPIPQLPSHSEVYELIENYRLWGRGLGWTDVNLLAVARLNQVPLWTRDKRLAVVSDEVGLTSFNASDA